MADSPLIQLGGNYSLRVELGGNELALSPGVFTLSITEYLDRYLSDLTLTVKDPTALVTNDFYPNSEYAKIDIMLNGYEDQPASISDNMKYMKFRIYRRFPVSLTSGVNSLRIVGLLDIKNLFSPQYQKGWYRTSVRSIISDIANDLGVQGLDIERELSNKIVNLVQPHWTNIQMLNYLVQTVQTRESGYCCYINHPAGSDSAAGKAKLHFRAISSWLNEKVRETFGFFKTPIKDVKSIYTYEAIDNYETTQILGLDKQRYHYWDYANGEFKEEEISLEQVGMPSLSKYINFDKITNTQGLHAPEMIRNDDYFKDPISIARCRYAQRINSALKIWIVTQGSVRINPGDLIMVVPSTDETNFNLVYTGAWMVERVVHHIDRTFLTKLLLTRPGIDTSTKMDDLKTAPHYKKTESTAVVKMEYA